MATVKLDENVAELVAGRRREVGHDVAVGRDEELAEVNDDALRRSAAKTPGIVVLRLRHQTVPGVRGTAAALAGVLSEEPLAGRLWIL